MTGQQETIRQELAGARISLSAQDLHARLRSAGHRIGLATVYRTLHVLAGEGAVDVLRASDRHRVYRACGSREPHHHLLCRSCGRTAEIPACTLDEWAAGAGAEHGFTEVALIGDLSGTCAGCAALTPPGLSGRTPAAPR